MKKRAVTLVTFAQSIFLNLKFFIQNGLLSYASACSFDLIFSVVPVLLMIILIAVRVLHASPELISSLYLIVPELKDYFNPGKVISAFQNVKTFSTLEIVLVFFIVWMARRFFASVFAALRNIFHDQQKRRALTSQVLIFVFELIFVSIVVTFIFAYMSIKTIITQPFFQRFEQLNFIYQSFLNGKALSYIPNVLFFIVSCLIYKIGAGTKPKLFLCIAGGAMCTGTFWVFRTVLHSFINVSRYNLIYGVLSNVILLLMDIFFFFVFFLFFAQYIFTCQFFDELLLGELYLLPKKEGSTFIQRLKRSLFIRPDFLLANELALTYMTSGEKLYTVGDRDTFAYYILKGAVKVTRSEYSEEMLYHRGDFFGELNCVLAKTRTSTAAAVIDTQIVKIRGKNFRFLVKSNPAVAQKVLSQLSTYLSKVHENNNDK
jgi:membrane protein